MSKTALLILLVMVLAAAGLWSTGALDALAQPRVIQARVEAAGAWGPALYIALAMALFSVFMLAPPVWASGVLWPLPLAFAYSFAAGLLASVLTYLLAQQFGRRWAQEGMPARIRKWEARLRQHPFGTIVTLRLLLWANPLVDVLAAITDIPFPAYLVATVVGLILPTALHVSLGAGGMAAANRLPWWGWLIVAALLLLGTLVYRARRGRELAGELQ